MCKLPKTSCDIPMPEVVTACSPKTIVRIKLCGVMVFNVTDMMAYLEMIAEIMKEHNGEE